MEDYILYEQPLHESIRVCLRLECLFEQLDYFVNKPDYWNDWITVATIIDIINVLDRPDYKAKMTKRLIAAKANLSRHLDDPQIDHVKLENILQQLTVHIDYLNNMNGKISQSLEQDEFLNGVRLRLSKTAGGRNFDFPLYHYWLNLPEDTRKTNIQEWLSKLTSFRQLLTLYLLLIRESGRLTEITATNGYYEKVLDTSIDCQLLQIYVPKNESAYPDISVGKHRMSLHFFQFTSINERPTQFKQDVTFKLALCV